MIEKSNFKDDKSDVKYVYKYRTFSKNHLQAMLENKVWFSVSAEFNDPFDSSQFLLSNEIKVSSLLDSIRNDPVQYKKVMEAAKLEGIDRHIFLADYVFKDGIEIDPHIFEVIKQNLTRAYIFSTCLTFGSIPMWSHYGDYHKGFCVRYNVEKLLKTSSEEVRYHAPVTYEEKCVDLLSIMNARDDIFLKIDQAIGTKSTSFGSEEEYRFILNETQRLDDKEDDTVGRYTPNSIPVIHDREAIDSIYFGMKAQLSDKKILKKLLSDSPHIKYFDLVAQNNFRMIEKPTDFLFCDQN